MRIELNETCHNYHLIYPTDENELYESRSGKYYLLKVNNQSFIYFGSVSNTIFHKPFDGPTEQQYRFIAPLDKLTIKVDQ